MSGINYDHQAREEHHLGDDEVLTNMKGVVEYLEGWIDQRVKTATP